MIERQRIPVAAVAPRQRQAVSKPSIPMQRQRAAVQSPVATEEIAIRRGRGLNYSSLCDKIWNNAGEEGIKTKDDLERAIRESNITLVPDTATWDMAVSAYMRNKGDSVKDIVAQRGKGSFDSMVRLWIDSLNHIFDNLRKTCTVKK